MKYENTRPPMAVILAAGGGSWLDPVADKHPKCLKTVGGSVILERMIRNCLSCGISQFVLILGNRGDDVKTFVDKVFRGIRVTYVINDRYCDTNSGHSLMLASAAIGAADFVLFDADVVFDAKILRQLMDKDMPNVLCIERKAALTDNEVKVIVDDQTRVTEIGRLIDAEAAIGKSVGIAKISGAVGPLLFAQLKKMMETKAHVQDGYDAAYARLVDNGIPFHVIDITGLKWCDIDTAEDFETGKCNVQISDHNRFAQSATCIG